MRVLRRNENFRITGAGLPANEYRIANESVEFRSLNLDGSAFTSLNDGWRVLDADEVELHFALRTPVAAWLDQAGYKIRRTGARGRSRHGKLPRTSSLGL